MIADGMSQAVLPAMNGHGLKQNKTVKKCRKYYT